jgi:hypothetical protein
MRVTASGYWPTRSDQPAPAPPDARARRLLAVHTGNVVPSLARTQLDGSLAAEVLLLGADTQVQPGNSHGMAKMGLLHLTLHDGNGQELQTYSNLATTNLAI